MTRGIWRITRYDLGNDFTRIVKYYAIMLVCVVGDCTMLRVSVRNNSLFDGSYVGFEGYLWKILGGSDFFSMQSRDIKLPIEYLFIGTMILLIMTGYTSKEFKTGGYRSLLPTGSRKRWLLAKYFMTVIKAIMVLSIIGLGLLMNLVFEGERFWRTNEGLITTILKFPIVSKEQTVMAIAVFACTVVAMSLILVSLDCLLDSLYALICGCIFLVASCYIDSFLFSGSNMMLIRNVVRMEGGMGIPRLLCFVWVLAMVLTIINFMNIEKKDIYQKVIA